MRSQTLRSAARAFAPVALGLLALPLSFVLVASATPRVSLGSVPSQHVLAAPTTPARRHGSREALRTAVIERRPLVRRLQAVGRLFDRGPAGSRSPMSHAIWLEARSAGAVSAHPGAPAEIALAGHELVGVVAASQQDSGGATVWIALDRGLVDRAVGKTRAGFRAISLELPLGAELAVPDRAVVDARSRPWVWLETRTGPQPRAIALGQAAEDFDVVTAGLEAGMRVVTDPRFLHPDPWGPWPD